MTREDDLLQEKLAAMEQGQPPSGDDETAGLVKLAAAVRDLPHPALSPQAAHQQQEALLRASNQPSEAISKPDVLRLVFFPAAAAVVAGLVLLAVIVYGLLAGPPGVHTARLAEANGVVQIARADAPDTWMVAKAGERLRSGDRVRTLGEGSSATLAFYDGSRTMLEAGTELALDRVDGAWGSVLRIVLTQQTGLTEHRVTPQRSADSLYVIYTPSSAASVHGTEFSVAVNDAGQSRFAVDRGQVLVTNEAGEVTLNAGQVATAHSDEVLDEPGYRFTLQGTLMSRSGSVWFVAQVPVTVSPDALPEGELQLGSTIQVEGHMLLDGEWVADWVRLAENAPQQVTFYGMLESNSGDAWQISGWSVLVTADTAQSGDLQPGEVVMVTLVTLPDGRWQAVSIASVGDEDLPTPPPVATPDPNAHPGLEFDPDELEVASCDAAYDLTGILYNEGEEPDDVAANVLLGYQVIRGATYVDAVTLDPSGWDVIGAGEQVTFNIHLDLADGWNSAPDETEVKVRIFILQETNRVDGHPTRLTVTVERDCDPGSTSTPTQTFTPGPSPTVTPTPTITSTPTVTPTGGPTAETNCTGAQPHPTGTKLAERYGVTYEEIMGWFCQGFGFGEIDLAYGLSLESGRPVAEIFAMKSGGMGWGEIKKLLDPDGKVPGDKNDKNNNKDK